MPNVNSESSKNGVNRVSGDKRLEFVAQKAERSAASKIRCFRYKMPNHKRSECPWLQPRSNNCARVGLEGQLITDNQFVIPLYVNGKLVDGYRDKGADISLTSRKIVGICCEPPPVDLDLHRRSEALRPSVAEAALSSAGAREGVQYRIYSRGLSAEFGWSPLISQLFTVPKMCSSCR